MADIVCKFDPVPAIAILTTMKSFEDDYNANDVYKAAERYAPTCDVTVNDGAVFTGKTSDEVGGFLGNLRNDLGGTNIKFAITRVEGNEHEDIWVADNGFGTCLATWQKVNGEWKIVKDRIEFTPKVDATANPNDGGVPTQTVLSTMKAFEDDYNADRIAKAAK